MATVGVHNNLTTIGPELSLLASQAATAIDRHIAGKATDFRPVEQLVDFLGGTVDASNARSAEHMFVMPGTLEVFDKAISLSKTGSPITTVNVLAEEARKIIARLSDSVTNKQAEQLPQLRDFCAAFSIATSNYLLRVHEMGPTHPNRR
ncbi:MAG: hypothetical protein KF886_08045 [Candidatus Hydrogenedentes bacterium]|nr:hypothetical protein [Candidatus Hydrogenedentota bacterium]